MVAMPRDPVDTPELREALTDTEYDSFIQAMTQIPAFAAEFATGKRKYPSVNLEALTKSDVGVVTNAIEKLASTPADTSAD